MTILVTGAGGQVGRELLRIGGSGSAGGSALASGEGLAAVAGLSHNDLDIADAAQVRAALRHQGARVLINAAAWTDVDGAERDPDAAFRANREGAAVLAAACAEAGIPLLHLSTDHVFDGHAGRPWREDDPVSPLGVYGASKAAGEQAIRVHLPAHLILRTSWVFGACGGNFVQALLARARAGETLAVVTDQVGGPTPARALAQALLALAARHLQGAALPWGTWHFAGAPCVSRHAFAERILAEALARSLLPAPVALRPLRAVDWPGAALRPANACLDMTRSVARLGLSVPDWREGLGAVLDEWAGVTGPT